MFGKEGRQGESGEKDISDSCPVQTLPPETLLRERADLIDVLGNETGIPKQVCSATPFDMILSLRYCLLPSIE